MSNTNVAQAENAETQNEVEKELGAWGSFSKDHVLYRFGSELKALLDEAAHDEMYGVKLVAPDEGYDIMAHLVAREYG